MKIYSKEQRQAIESFGSELRVFAGAGSGKTTVLVERYFRALTHQGTAPERMLAITFTDKAANKMKGLLVAECGLRGLEAHRRMLENSQISTIHSLCAKILKENPIEAGVDPHFKILADGESEILMAAVMERLFEEQAANPDCVRLLTDYDERPLSEAIGQFYDLDRALGGDPSLFKHDSGASEEKAARRRLLAGLDAFLSQAGPEAEAMRKTAAQLRALLETETGEEVWPLLHRVREWGDTLHRRGRHKESIAAVRDLLDAWAALQVQRAAEPMKKEFLRLFRRFQDAYDGEKRKRGCYDFDDLLFLTYRLLSGDAVQHKEVRRRLQEQFSHILLDEHQDTSPLQAAIIRLIARGDNLFLVGDAQQSIYGFRHADPDVFGCGGPRRAAGGPRSVYLSDNYRSRPEVLAFVNRVFAAFTGDAFRPLKPMASFKAAKSCCVELLCFFKSEDDERGKNAVRILEARTLASRIRQMVDSGMTVEEGGHGRPIRYGDIAVLFKATTSSRLYEKELQEASVPYFTLKGRGFYEKQEIKDVLNFLKLIEDIDADIPLAGVLRSPLFGVSDNGLFWLARRAKQGDDDRPLAGALPDLAAVDGLSPEDTAKLKRFKEVLASIRRDKSRLRLSEVLGFLLRATQYEAKVLAGPQGRQKAANLRKLLEMAGQLEQKGVFGIADFVRFLQGLSERDAESPEARVDAQAGDVVMLSSVHAAKGLEFPCVIIADMGAGKKSGRGHFLAARGAGFGLRVRDPWSGKFLPDLSYSCIAASLTEKENAEDLRVLYVAMTRAKEHLILSGLSEGGEEGEGRAPSWMGRLARALGLNAETQASEFLDFEGFSVRRLSPHATPAPRQDTARISRLAEHPPVRAALDTLTPLDGRRVDGWDERFLRSLKEKLEFPPKQYDAVYDATVTEILSQSLKDGGAPLKAFDAEVELVHAEDAETDAPRRGRNEFGALFHHIMEHLVQRRGQKFKKSLLGAFTRTLGGAEKKEMEESVARFWGGPWGQVVRRAERCYCELPFIYKTRYGMLKGQMDLVFSAGKEWVVLDYKTNVITAAQKQATAEGYALQLGLYALVFKKLYGEAPARGVLYFSALDDSHSFSYRQSDFEAVEAQMLAHFKALAVPRPSGQPQTPLF